MSSDNLVIISLTSIKSRYDNKMLHNTIESLLNLNYDNYIIVLNISKEPKYLDSGFTDSDIEMLSLLYPKIKINVVENYGSIRKIIPTLKLFNNNIIITVDDDVIYDKNIISTFVDAYNLFKCIVSARCRIIDINCCYRITDFQISENEYECNMNLLGEGVGGILYHSSMFDSKFINFNFNNLEEEFLKNDDLLLKSFSIIKNIPVYYKFSPYEELNPTIGLYTTFNENYIINFQKFIDKVKFILD
jgi:hypothetical protein